MYKFATNKLIVIGIVFLLGLYFMCKSCDVETFTPSSDGDDTPKIAKNCPDVLIQKGSAFFLYNSKRASVPGINPIRFENLEEYIEFTEWQRSQGILCPILYLQHAFNAQGDAVYKAHPSPTNLRAGLPDYYVTEAILNQSNLIPPPTDNFSIQGMDNSRSLKDIRSINNEWENKLIDAGQNRPPYNTNSYPGFDAHDQYIGIDTPLDKMYNDSTNKVSPNPMDHNWGGIAYTEKLVASGFYAGNEVSKSKI